jgi:hypothetical protein
LLGTPTARSAARVGRRRGRNEPNRAHLTARAGGVHGTRSAGTRRAASARIRPSLLARVLTGVLAGALRLRRAAGWSRKNGTPRNRRLGRTLGHARPQGRSTGSGRALLSGEFLHQIGTGWNDRTGSGLARQRASLHLR